MSIGYWLKLIGEILILIGENLSLEKAITTVSATYGVDRKKLKKMFEAYENGELKDE